MAFGSLFFLTVFLPPVLLVHWALQMLERRCHCGSLPANLWLLAASLAACVLSDLPGLPVFLGCAVVTDLLARAIAASENERMRKLLLAVALVSNLGLLCFFKYADVIARWIDALAGSALIPVPQLTLPLGISFWIFRSMSYVTDVSRGVHPPARNPLDFLCYMALFPIFVSGPIVRWSEVQTPSGTVRFPRRWRHRASGGCWWGLPRKSSSPTNSRHSPTPCGNSRTPDTP